MGSKCITLKLCTTGSFAALTATAAERRSMPTQIWLALPALSLMKDTLREFPFFLGWFMTQVEHDISDFEEAGEAIPGGVPERQWHHHVEDDELYKGRQKNLKGRSRSSPPPRCKSLLPT